MIPGCTGFMKAAKRKDSSSTTTIQSKWEWNNSGRKRDHFGCTVPRKVHCETLETQSRHGIKDCDIGNWQTKSLQSSPAPQCQGIVLIV